MLGELRAEDLTSLILAEVEMNTTYTSPRYSRSIAPGDTPTAMPREWKFSRQSSQYSWMTDHCAPCIPFVRQGSTALESQQRSFPRSIRSESMGTVYTAEQLQYEEFTRGTAQQVTSIESSEYSPRYCSTQRTPSSLTVCDNSTICAETIPLVDLPSSSYTDPICHYRLATDAFQSSASSDHLWMEGQSTDTVSDLHGLGIFLDYQNTMDQTSSITSPMQVRGSATHAISGRQSWSPEEDNALTIAVVKLTPGQCRWKNIAELLGNTRSSKLYAKRWDYLCKTSLAGIKRGRWRYDEDVALAKLVENWQDLNTGVRIDWSFIARQLPRPRNGTQAQARYTETLDPRINKGWWTPEELNLLQTAIDAYGGSWLKISECIPGRTQ